MDVQQQRKRAQRQFARENAVKSREEAKKYHDLVVKRKKEAPTARRTKSRRSTRQVLRSDSKEALSPPRLGSSASCVVIVEEDGSG